jgi:hypothetical protein
MLSQRDQERKQGISLAPAFAAKGWRRDVSNNTFIKEDKEAFFSNGYLVFCFPCPQFKGMYSKSIHKIKLQRK